MGSPLRKASGVTDCVCCGVHIMAGPGGKCDSCKSGECDPAVTWHCSEIDWCDGTVCETHTPVRWPSGRHKPRYVQWAAPDGTPGRFRLDRDADGTGWWVSRRFPGTGGVEWIGHVTQSDSSTVVTRPFASMYGEGLAHKGTSWNMSYFREASRVSRAARWLAVEVVTERLRHGVYGIPTIGNMGC